MQNAKSTVDTFAPDLELGDATILATIEQMRSGDSDPEQLAEALTLLHNRVLQLERQAGKLTEQKKEEVLHALNMFKPGEEMFSADQAGNSIDTADFHATMLPEQVSLETSREPLPIEKKMALLEDFRNGSDKYILECIRKASDTRVQLIGWEVLLTRKQATGSIHLSPSGTSFTYRGKSKIPVEFAVEMESGRKDSVLILHKQGTNEKAKILVENELLIARLVEFDDVFAVAQDYEVEGNKPFYFCEGYVHALCKKDRKWYTISEKTTTPKLIGKTYHGGDSIRTLILDYLNNRWSHRLGDKEKTASEK